VKYCRILIVIALLGIIAVPALTATKWNFSIGTSTLGGSFYIMGAPWAKVISEHVPDAIATVQATNGPSANIQLIERGEMKLAYVSSAAAYEGWNGLSWAKGTKFQRMRTMFTTYSSYFEMVTLTKLPIKNIRDLQGKRVHMSMPNGTPDIAMTKCLEELGIKPKDKQYMQTDQAIDQLKDGKLDVVIFAMGLPTSMILDLQSTHDIRVLDISKEDIDLINTKYPYFAKGIIPAGTYENMPNDVNTFVFWNYAVCDKDLPDELVYQITKAVFENKADFVAASAYGKELAAKNIANAVVPLHPGAIKYYKEIGINIPSHLLPPDSK